MRDITIDGEGNKYYKVPRCIHNSALIDHLGESIVPLCGCTRASYTGMSPEGSYWAVRDEKPRQPAVK
jgi:hypothetical protein